MRATLIYGAGDIRVEDVPDPRVREATDAVVRVVRACICGSDLWPYGSRPATEQGDRIGHEFLGVVEDTGAEVSGLRRGDLVVAPFAYADNTCAYCADGLHTSCPNGGYWGQNGVDGGQGEAVRVPWAQGTLVKLPVGEDSPLLPSLLTLSDVFCTGHHCAVKAGVGPRTTVTVVGDGAVGLSAVLASARLGAERIVLMGRHADRTSLGRDFGATDVVPERGEEGVARVRELTGGEGTHTVLECVGTETALETALGVVRDGGTVSRVGVPQYEEGPVGYGMFSRNVTLTGGVAPARAYIEELLPDVLEGRIEPGRVFDRTVGLEGVPDGYRAMAAREALKVLVRP
ncbi:alcohol dehydrogenase catalytic domain-containing protein [Streptomyces sp. NPDC049577]|uniref:zinc-binding dehydrogenase n=1 Tax=Streptomyces sp. NPDC049577 TaxID=3155153 RepID=UPI00341D64A7